MDDTKEKQKELFLKIIENVEDEFEAKKKEILEKTKEEIFDEAYLILSYTNVFNYFESLKGEILGLLKDREVLPMHCRDILNLFIKDGNVPSDNIIAEMYYSSFHYEQASLLSTYEEIENFLNIMNN